MVDERLLDEGGGHPWHEALKQFREAKFPVDTVIKRQWFYEQMGITYPTEDMPVGRADRLRLQFVDQFTQLRRELLEADQMDLVAVPGEGYKIIPPTEQTKAAYADGVQEVRKGLRRMQARLTNVDTRQLNAEQRRENTEALAQLCLLKKIERESRHVKFLLSPEGREGDS